MDKYEFNIKVEQIKKQVKVGDYATAMKICDGIDWRRVSSVSLLSMVSEIYEKNYDFAEAKEILTMAYEKAPTGKRLLYKLCLLSISEGNIEEAEVYYREFYDLAPEDARQHLLRYSILKAKGAPVEQLISSLEAYLKVELDERYLYELAELYHLAGRHQECVATCDRIMLMFGIGNYVDRAIELKTIKEGCPLTETQKALIDSREQYKEKIQAIEEEYNFAPDVKAIMEEEAEEQLKKEDGFMMAGAAAAEATASAPGIAGKIIDAPSVSVVEDTAPIIREDAETKAFEPKAQSEVQEYTKESAANADEAQAVSSAQVAGAQTVASVQAASTQPQEKAKPVYTINFIVERKTPEAGFESAKRLLRLMHEHTGSTNGVTKIKASKLNQIGIRASMDKIAGKDLIIEEAGDLAFDTVEQIVELIREEPDKRIIVLIDNPMQLTKIQNAHPRILNYFHLDSDDAEEYANKHPELSAQSAAIPKAKMSEQTTPAGFNAGAGLGANLDSFGAGADGFDTGSASDSSDGNAASALRKKFARAEEEQEKIEKVSASGSAEGRAARQPAEPEMDIDDFANYCKKYAESIDCSISGKSMLALYERIEIMEEDGIPLTQSNAVELIEEAADKAEKKSLGNLFAKKYDKEDKLILREEHFID